MKVNPKLTKEQEKEMGDIVAELSAEKKAEREEMFNEIAEYNPKAMLLEPRETYDHAVHGYSLEGRVIYAYSELISSLICDDQMSHEDAVEYFDFNIRGTFEGMSDPNRPIFNMYQ
jgi:hypothetical protein